MAEKNIEIVKNYDPEVGAAMEAELLRQRGGIELIASENFVSEPVMAAMGSILTNKYAEGFPGKRYYGGCACVDVVENIARDRAKEIFGAEHANVQPHSGAQANLAVYFALLKPGDTVMGMSLAEGGHLTHGSPVNMSGMYYNFVPYGVSAETGRIDYEEIDRLAHECHPKLIVAGASAYPRTIDFERISKTAKDVGAYFMVDMARYRGTCRGRTSPLAVPLCGRRDDNDPQDAPRSARRHDTLQSRACKTDRQGNLPRHAGRPAHAYNRGEGGMLR